jgi:hypothetical protein
MKISNDLLVLYLGRHIMARKLSARQTAGQSGQGIFFA